MLRLPLRVHDEQMRTQAEGDEHTPEQTVRATRPLNEDRAIRAMRGA
jgi:hypothetical protein